MKFVTTCVVTAGKTNTIGFPILTKQSLVPHLISVTEIKDGVEVPITGVLCRVQAGGTEVGNYGEPTFKLTNEMDLSPYKGLIDRSGKVSVTITNRTIDPKRVKLYADYKPSHGGVLLEEKIDHFENLLNDIHSKGFCTRLVISFNKPVETLEFASVAEHVDGDGGEWIQPFNVPIDTALDVEDQVYTIDFAERSLGLLYSENLNFLEARAVAKKSENDREPFYMYVTAYGFPYQH
jgi:hypothetical protein